MRTALFTLVLSLLAAACTLGESDSSLYLTGTEEAPLTNAKGMKSCAGKKVLICHIPPGNPANAHTICVGESAVAPHTSHHGDGVGACATEPEPPPAEPPPSDDPGSIN